MGKFEPQPASAAFLSSLIFGLSVVGCGDVGDAPYEGPIGETSAAVVQDCGEILALGIFDTVTETSHDKDTYALAKGFCDEVQKSASGGGDTSFSYLGIGGTLSGHASKSSFKKYCEYFDEKSTSDEAHNLMTSVADPNIVAAWAQCVSAQEGLACYQKPGEPVIGVTYSEVGNSGPLKGVTLTPTNLTVRNPAAAVPVIDVGDTGLGFRITNTSEDANLLINGKTELTKFAQFCSVEIKSQVKINRELKQAWHRIAEDYKSIKTDLEAYLQNDGYAPADVLGRVKPLLADASAKYTNAKAQEAACTDTSTRCQMPSGADLTLEGTFPAMNCYFVTTLGPPKKHINAARYAYSVLDFSVQPPSWPVALDPMGPGYFCKLD